MTGVEPLNLDNEVLECVKKIESLRFRRELLKEQVVVTEEMLDFKQEFFQCIEYLLQCLQSDQRASKEPLFGLD